MNQPTRRGKIARLPAVLREQLNERLFEGGVGRQCVAWLNTLPEVQAVLAAQFGGKAISEQNLTEWRQGGYRDWLNDREARGVADRFSHAALRGNREGHLEVTDTLACWVAGRYALNARRVVGAAEGKAQWQLLREMCHDVVALRRGDIRGKFMKLMREKMALRMTADDSLGLHPASAPNPHGKVPVEQEASRDEARRMSPEDDGPQT